MKKVVQKEIKNKWLKRMIILVSVIFAGLLGAGLDLAIRPTITEDGKITFSIELSTNQVPAEIETEDGTIEVMQVATVESIDGNQLTDECPEDEPECGKGMYIYAPTETPNVFKDYTIGKCWNTDGAYGAQCWDLADLFWQNYAGRNFSTCGTGAAKGSWNCKEYNAGDNFDLIYDKTKLQAGDWVIFGSGAYGHVGMALGGYNNGYVALLGQNQGGYACEGGGSSTNIINISLNSFIGAFRPKSYIKPEPVPPAPTPIPVSGCVQWHVERGDSMSKIMLECEGTVVYGEPMNAYARTWYSLIYNKGKSVYDGWISENGVGLFEGDDIEHRINP